MAGTSGAGGGGRAAPAMYSGLIPSALNGSQFQEDFMLPEQYFARLRQQPDCPGEQRLLLAVLEDAVHCFQANQSPRNRRRQRMLDEAEEWLFDPASDAVVTFEYVCGVFGLDPEYLRAGLRRWRDLRGSSATPCPSGEVPRVGREVGDAPLKHAVGE
jgi:hypothetical protein